MFAKKKKYIYIHVYAWDPSGVRAITSPCHTPGRCNCCFQGHATLRQDSQTLQLLLPGLRNAAATLPDAAVAASWVTQSSSSNPGRCNCSFQTATLPDAATAAFWVHATLQQRYQSLRLLLLEPRNASATLPVVVTVASGTTQRSSSAPRRCNCCFGGRTTLLQRFRTLQPQNGLRGPLPCAQALGGFATWPPRSSSPRRCNCLRNAPATLQGTT